MPYHYLLIGLFMLAACSPKADERTMEVTNDGIVEPMDLIGAWQDVQDSGRTVFREIWEKADDGGLKGLGFVLSGKDTVFIEHLAIRDIENTLHYTATIGDQNDGGTVHFGLVHAQDSLVFTNPQHDFPQRIVYTPVESHGWSVTVSGRAKGMLITDRYLFSRMPTADIGANLR